MRVTPWQWKDGLLAALLLLEQAASLDLELSSRLLPSFERKPPPTPQYPPSLRRGAATRIAFFVQELDTPLDHLHFCCQVLLLLPLLESPEESPQQINQDRDGKEKSPKSSAVILWIVFYWKHRAGWMILL